MKQTKENILKLFDPEIKGLAKGQTIGALSGYDRFTATIFEIVMDQVKNDEIRIIIDDKNVKKILESKGLQLNFMYYSDYLDVDDSDKNDQVIYYINHYLQENEDLLIYEYNDPNEIIYHDKQFYLLNKSKYDQPELIENKEAINLIKSAYVGCDYQQGITILQICASIRDIKKALSIDD